MDGVQLSQGYRATTRRKFNFYHYESCKNLTKMFLNDLHYKISELNRESEHFYVGNISEDCMILFKSTLLNESSMLE